MVIPLLEGTFTVDHAKHFIPFQPATDQLQHRPAGSLLVDIVSFLIATPDELIVIDPGLGTVTAGTPSIHNAIRQAGYHPDDVTCVLLSHLHKDHAAGCAHHLDGSWQLMFPRARYFCQEKEFAFAFGKPESRSYPFEVLRFLYNHPSVEKLHGPTRFGTVTLEVSGGHTPHHQVFHIHDIKNHYFFGGDVAAQAGQLLRRFRAKYDVDPLRSKQLRDLWAHSGAEQGWHFLFFHDARHAITTLERQDARLVLKSYYAALHSE